MFVSNTDLLPPLFDRFLELDEAERRNPFAAKVAIDGARVREQIVTALETGIVNAAANSWRRRSRDAVLHQRPNDAGDVCLTTSDRLSGADISRAGLVAQLQAATKLRTTVLEVALLLVEAQIDLRLKGGKSFELSGLSFARGEEGRVEQAADWCKVILDPAVQRLTRERGVPWWPFAKGDTAGIRVLLETLQLSATVRDALPYVITVVRHRVEPLIAQQASSEGIRLLHVSDLHIVDDIASKGGREKIPFGVPTHSVDRASTVATAVRGLTPRYDLLIATGDLTAGGGRASFETVLQYLQQGAVTGENPMRIATQGLSATPSQRILLPGNHDRYANKVVLGQRLNSLFEDVLQTHRGYPYWVGYRPHREVDNPKALTLLFVVFDSTLPEGREGIAPNDWAGAVAQGEVRAAELDEALELLNGLLEPDEKKIARLGGGEMTFDPANTIRIALLHHHPVEKAVLPPETDVAKRSVFETVGDFLASPLRAKSKLEKRLMAMSGSDVFLRGCFRCGVQLVLFGHQHYPYQRLIRFTGANDFKSPFGVSRPYIRAFCCPTTLQYDAPAYGFYVFDFPTASAFEWTMFAAEPEPGFSASPLRRKDGREIHFATEPSDKEAKEQYDLALG
jgi:hypothetical protein